MIEPEPRVYKVIHARDGVETVYLVSAIGPREAKRFVLGTLYPEHAVQWTIGYVCRINKCAVNADLFRPDPPYKLYTFDTRTGAMS